MPVIGERMDYDAGREFKLCYRSGEVRMPKIDLPEPLKVEAAHFLECTESQKVPLTGPSHALDVVRVLEAGQRALTTGEVVKLELPFSRAA